MTEKNLYEIMFILNPDLGQQQTDKEIEEVKELISSNEGKITFEDIWGMKDFAYRIGKQDHGYYVVLNFEIGADRLSEMNHQLNLNQHVLRHLIVKAPKNYKNITFEELRKEQELETSETEAKRKAAKDKRDKKDERPARKPEKYAEKPAQPAKEAVKKEEKPKKVELEEEKEVVETEEKPVKKKTAKAKMSELEDVDEKLKNIINDPDISL